MSVVVNVMCGARKEALLPGVCRRGSRVVLGRRPFYLVSVGREVMWCSEGGPSTWCLWEGKSCYARKEALLPGVCGRGSRVVLGRRPFYLVSVGGEVMWCSEGGPSTWCLWEGKSCVVLGRRPFYLVSVGGEVLWC